MRIAFLGSANSWYLRDLARAVAGTHSIEPVSFRELGSYVGADRLEFRSKSGLLSDFDCLLVRTMPHGSLEQVVFRMDLLGQWQHGGRLVVNAPRTIEAAVDKYLALTRIRKAGLLVPRTIACQTWEQALVAFHDLGQDVVVKPLFGSEGRGLTRISDPALAERAFKMLDRLDAVLYLQEFIEHEGYDLRLMTIGQRVLAMRRRNPHDWRTNVSQGAVCEPLTPTDGQIETAFRAAQSMGASIAGVDLLPARDGQLYTLEVNAVPGWRALSSTLKIDVAKLVTEFLEYCHSTPDGRANLPGPAL